MLRCSIGVVCKTQELRRSKLVFFQGMSTVKYVKPLLALILNERLEGEGSIYPNVHAFTPLVKASIKLKNLDLGPQIHGHALAKGSLQIYCFLGNALVDLYEKCDSLSKTQDLFS